MLPEDGSPEKLQIVGISGQMVLQLHGEALQAIRDSNQPVTCQAELQKIIYIIFRLNECQHGSILKLGLGVAFLRLFEAKNFPSQVKALKCLLAEQLGFSRFQQRLVRESLELPDDAPLIPPLTLHLVIFNFQPPCRARDNAFLDACINNQVLQVEEMLQSPQDPDTRDAECASNPTALHAASKKGHVEVVRLLLDAKADKDATDCMCRTALHWAAVNYNLLVVQLLVEAGADKDARDDKVCRTALHWAAAKGHLLVVQLLVEAGADKDSRDKEGKTALHWAAEKGYLEVVRLLLEAGADKDASDAGGATALHFAAGNGRELVVRMLLESGADKSATDEEGLTALHWAIDDDNMDMQVVQLLL